MKQVKLIIYTVMAMGGLVLVGADAGDWPSQIMASSGGIIMLLLGIFFITETLGS